jgi:diacylglycerol kinase family enzyme
MFGPSEPNRSETESKPDGQYAPSEFQAERSPSQDLPSVPVVLNAKGGSIAGKDVAGEIVKAFRELGKDADVHLLAPDEMLPAIRKMAGAPLLVVGGGDGTLGSAAMPLAEKGSTLGILPLGTRNHLARQLGIPLNIADAVRIVLEGEPRRIDLGAVNGHGFVNNASIGFYPLMVRWRDEERRRHGLPKWMANIVAGSGVLRRLRHHNLHLELDGAQRTIRTPLLFVGNNSYSLEAGHIGEREGLNDGLLSIFAVTTRTRAGSVLFALRTMVGRADPEADFAVCETARELKVEAHSDQVNVALDGEVQRLQSPLRFSIMPSALTVMAPPEPAAGA